MNLRAVAITALGLLALPITAQAGSHDALLQAMQQCSTFTDNERRLSCYDELSAQVKQALATDSSAPQAVGEQATPQQFGSEYLPGQASKPGQVQEGPIDSVTANVTDYALNPFGKFVVFLESGQVWKQIDGEADIANFKKGGENTVMISRGFLGSYNMQINGSNKVFKVKRIK